MEEVLGAHTDPEQFESFLADWEAVLARRVEETVETFARIPGVCGIILAGSLGRGEAWPLSDIDLLLICERSSAEETSAEIERRRTEPLSRWAREGWWSGIDAGNLVFYQDEISQTFQYGDDGFLARLHDRRWYHSVDKGYRGQAVYGPSGQADELVQWFTAHRFRPEVTRLRLERGSRELLLAWERLQERRIESDRVGVVKELLGAVAWLRIWHMEAWGERDNSLARFGTRFERVAVSRSATWLIGAINEVSDLDDEHAAQRMRVAPWWVKERHDRQWRARHVAGESVSRAEDIRDVLRVSVQYALREPVGTPIPPWLGVPANLDVLDQKIFRLQEIIRQAIPNAFE